MPLRRVDEHLDASARAHLGGDLSARCEVAHGVRHLDHDVGHVVVLVRRVENALDAAGARDLVGDLVGDAEVAHKPHKVSLHVR